MAQLVIPVNIITIVPFLLNPVITVVLLTTPAISVLLANPSRLLPVLENTEVTPVALKIQEVISMNVVVTIQELGAHQETAIAAQ